MKLASLGEMDSESHSTPGWRMTRDEGDATVLARRRCCQVGSRSLLVNNVELEMLVDDESEVQAAKFERRSYIRCRVG